MRDFSAKITKQKNGGGATRTCIDNRVLSGIYSADSWQCFLTVLILESTFGFRVTALCLFLYIFMLCFPDASSDFLHLPDTSWSIQTLSDASFCFLWLPVACWLRLTSFCISFCTRLLQHQTNNKQTNKILWLWESQAKLKYALLKSTVSL